MGQTGSANPAPVPGGPGEANDGPSWWCKLVAKGAGVAAGLSALIIGVMNCFTFTPICLAAAVILMMIGCMLIALEAPCCCPFLDFIQPLGRWSDARPHLQKAILYGVCAVVPIALCFTLTQLLSCALIMATAVFYGLMALGKKGDRNEMAVRARTTGDTEMKATLINNMDIEADQK
ncbi:calcium channel flower homolog [Haliotis cracherodii]|uniref:calcium channel flower homolog n=1 Tax=Haliotis cracherodii TaxID=6455 RepID=UPI0039EA7593